MDKKDEVQKALDDLVAGQRAQMLIDLANVISPLLIVICGELPNPLRLADKLDELAAAPEAQSGKLPVQVAAYLATALASAIRKNAGGVPRSNA